MLSTVTKTMTRLLPSSSTKPKFLRPPKAKVKVVPFSGPGYRLGEGKTGAYRKKTKSVVRIVTAQPQHKDSSPLAKFDRHMYDTMTTSSTRTFSLLGRLSYALFVNPFMTIIRLNHSLEMRAIKQWNSYKQKPMNSVHWPERINVFGTLCLARISAAVTNNMFTTLTQLITEPATWKDHCACMGLYKAPFYIGTQKKIDTLGDIVFKQQNITDVGCFDKRVSGQMEYTQLSLWYKLFGF